MDKVRFGRALGYGTRHAAKTLLEATKAASAPAAPANTRRQATTASSAAPSVSTPMPTLQEAGKHVVGAHRTVTQTRQRIHTQTRAAGRSAFAPLKRAGGVLWLELTGTIFAMFALFMAPGLWKLRDSLHAPPGSGAAHKLYLYALLCALFVYFSVSSFVRAHRRGRQP